MIFELKDKLEKFLEDLQSCIYADPFGLLEVKFYQNDNTWGKVKEIVFCSIRIFQSNIEDIFPLTNQDGKIISKRVVNVVSDRKNLPVVEFHSVEAAFLYIVSLFEAQIPI